MNYLDPELKTLRLAVIRSALLTTFNNIDAIARSPDFCLDEQQLLALVRETRIALALLTILELVG